MSRLLQSFPEPLLDELVKSTLVVTPSLRHVFLSSLGSHMHTSAVRVLFRTLSIPDDARVFSKSDNSFECVISPLLSNPERYSAAVKTIDICDPYTTGHQEHEQDTFRPVEAEQICRLLTVCSNLEELVWKSMLPPPDGLCEMLMSHNPRLTRFFIPRHLHLPNTNGLAKWDAPALPLLSTLSITSLSLSRLSQAGARAFAALLARFGEDSLVEDLSIDFIWLDDQLCDKIAKSGWRLRKLSISTAGTKLSDKGIVSIIERCDALEEFVLDEVQGRLSRSLWTKPSHFPAGLRCFRIIVNETGPHHSWSTDHLASLHALPIEKLSIFSIVRREALPRLINGVPTIVSVVDDAVDLKPTPKDFVESMRGGASLVDFQCDFWAWSIADIKAILESCPKLEVLKICVNAPFPKITGLTSTFASLPMLRVLSISVSPEHAPGTPPAPSLPFLSSSLPTPSHSPVLKSKVVLPQLLDFDQIQTQICNGSSNVGDSSMPLLRDVKRFVRKCPKLSLLEWYGKAGRGSWSVSRPITTSKISINVTVEYNPPAIKPETWKYITQDKECEESIQKGRSSEVIERVGQVWTGERAESFERERLAEKKKEDAVSPVEHSRKAKEPGKRGKTLSVSTSMQTSKDNAFLSSASTSRSPDSSPIQTFSLLTPPQSETSFSDYVLSSHISENTRQEVDIGLGGQSLNRKRSPSEPTVKANGSYKSRMRSATASFKDGNNLDRNDHTIQNSGCTKSSVKQKRRNHGTSGRTTRSRNHTSGNEDETPMSDRHRTRGSGGSTFTSSSNGKNL